MALQDHLKIAQSGASARRYSVTGLIAPVRTPLVLVLALTALSTLLRLYDLDSKGFWHDELFTANVVRLATYADLMQPGVWPIDNAPLTYVLTWLLRGLGGGEVAVRLPYALVGGLAIPALYALG